MQRAMEIRRQTGAIPPLQTKGEEEEVDDDDYELIQSKINKKEKKKIFNKLPNPYQISDFWREGTKRLKIIRKSRIDLINKLFLYDDLENLIINDCFNEEEIYISEYLSKDKRNDELEVYNKEGNLIFKGEYINGVKYGKEFDINGNLVFKGEYFNGKRFNGRGKEFYSDGKLKFGGEYINWEKKGKKYVINPANGNLILLDGIKSDNKTNNDNNSFKGKEYDNRGNIIFEGYFSFGKRIKGKRKIYDSRNNLLFEIDYDKNSFSKVNKKVVEIYSIYEEDGNKIEKGKEINFENNSIFEGDFSNGEK